MEENTYDENLDSSPEEVVEEEVEETSDVSEDVQTPTKSEPSLTKADKTVPYERFKQVNDELSKLKNQPAKVVNTALDVEDYIDISASLEGLDQKEKEFLAEQHKLSGKSLKDIRNDENFLLWQGAYREKVEKERLTLTPSGKQTEASKPKSIMDKLASATFEEKEKILAEAGLYKNPRPGQARINIGKGF